MNTWIEINTVNLFQNVRQIRDVIGEGTKLYAVVKSNAYGHGLEIVSEALWRANVDGFVVTEASDALYLNQHYYHVPVLLLNPPDSKDLPALLQKRIRLALSSEKYVDELLRVASRYAAPVRVHLELETGMHRMGVSIDRAMKIIDAASSGELPLEIEAVFSHLYYPDNRETSERQVAAVQDFLFELQQRKLPMPAAHLLATEGIGHRYDYTSGMFDGVRIGRGLYGVEKTHLQTLPILSWKTRIIRIEKLKREETVGYDATFTTERDRLIGTLPIGYADGFDRRLSNKGYVLVQGKRCQVLGRVNMNQTVIDLSAVLNPELGDEVVILGEQGQAKITPADMATWIDTIDYEILARISPTIPRLKVR